MILPRSPKSTVPVWALFIGAIFSTYVVLFATVVGIYFFADNCGFGCAIVSGYALMPTGILAAYFAGWLFLRGRIKHDRFVTIFAGSITLLVGYSGASSFDWLFGAALIVFSYLVAYALWSILPFNRKIKISISFVCLTGLYFASPVLLGTLTNQQQKSSNMDTIKQLGFQIYTPATLPLGYEQNGDGVPQLSEDKAYGNTYEIYYLNTKSDKDSFIIKEYADTTTNYKPPTDCGDDHLVRVPCREIGTMPDGSPIYTGQTQTEGQGYYSKQGQTIISLTTYSNNAATSFVPVFQSLHRKTAAELSNLVK